jgi:hypothetical protein
MPSGTFTLNIGCFWMAAPTSMAMICLRQFKTAMQLRNGWRGVLDGWNVETVLVPPSCALAQALLLDAHWKAVYSDSKALVLVRTRFDLENAANSHISAAGSTGK